MNIDVNSWHCRLFRFHYRMKHGYEQCVGYDCPWYTNLCPYMRTVLFWWWMRFLFIDGHIPITKRFRIPMPVVSFGYLYFLFPGFLGMYSYDLKMGMYTLDFMATVIFLAVVIAHAFRNLKNWWRGKRQPKDTVGFMKLTENYIHAVHDQICPTLHIVKRFDA